MCLMLTVSQNEDSKKKSQNDSDEESGGAKRDEPDRALMMFRPMVSDPIYIHRKSPLPRSKKIGSVEVSVYEFSLLTHLFVFRKSLNILCCLRIVWGISDNLRCMCNVC